MTGQGADDGATGEAVTDAFVEENRAYVRTLSEALLALSETPDRDRLDEAFRAAHSLKANCEVAGLDGAAAVAHAVEDVLAAVRAGRQDLDADTADEALGAVEQVGDAIEGARGGAPGIDASERVARLRARLDAIDDGDGGGATTGDDDVAVDDPALDLDPAVREALDAASDYDDLDALVADMDDDAAAFAGLQGGGSFDGLVDATTDDGADDGTAADTTASDQPGPTAGTGTAPAAEEPAPGPDDGEGAADPPAGEAAVVPPDTTDEPEDAGEPDGPVVGDAAEVAPWTGAAPPAAREAFGPSEGLWVPGAGRTTEAAPTIAGSALDAGRFDATPAPEDGTPASVAAALGPVRELTVEGRRLAAVLDAAANDDERVADALTAIREAADALGGVATREGLRSLDRLVADMERAAEAAARRTDAEVELEADAAPVAVDRRLVDRLADPLVHLVRNAIDHGIESPAERGAAAKPRQGAVAVRAHRDGGRLVVVVADDGRGVDADAVREAAVEAGVLDPGADLTDAAVRDLLFEPGLSTADEDSDLSGRGVGMDVVGRAVEALDGSVAVDSAPGAGTTVRLTVPLALAVARVRFVAVGHETYALPSAAVSRVVPVADATVQGGAVRAPAATVDRDAMGGAGAFQPTRDYRIVDLREALSVPPVPPVDFGVGAGATAATPEPEEPAYLLVEPERPADDEPGAAARPGADPELAGLALRCDGTLDERETLVTPLDGPAGELPAVDAAAVRDAGQVVVLLDPHDPTVDW